MQHQRTVRNRPENRALDGFVNADNAVNDVAIDLMFNGAIVPGTHADTFLTPERFRYEPAGGVPAGNYSLQVCDFDDPGNTVWAALAPIRAR